LKLLITVVNVSFYDTKGKHPNRQLIH
jgi:hypothetical protein